MNLTAIISTFRHGDKDSEGNLTEQGVKKAGELGYLSENLEGDVILFHSGSERVKGTVAAIGGNLKFRSADEKEEQDANYNLQTYTSSYLHYLIDPKIESKFFEKWEKIDKTPESANKRIQDFIDLKENSPEPGIVPSPKEYAKRVAKLIVTQIEFATITDSVHKTNFINGTHEPVLTSFLYYFMNDFDPKGEDFIKNIGGSINFIDGFELRVYQYFDEIEIKFKFRDYEGQVDFNALKNCL